ncbi:O-antigen ligase family protein [candidate division CSSED10-310 bacterium]|uniref:O-antigen ligase family protein n=1 Tax=candidate division CSSED10-310 bacterium TaxID=2855610 RepID=A0ABV6YU32_UNCC1
MLQHKIETLPEESLTGKLIRFTFIIFILLIPFQIYFDIYGDLSLTVITIILFVLLLLLSYSLGGPFQLLKIDHQIMLYIYLFMASMILSAVLANDALVSLKYCLKWLVLMTTYIMVYWSIIFLPDREDFFLILTVTASIITSIGIFFFVLGEEAFQEFLTTRAAALFIDPATIRFGEINWFKGGGTGGTFFNRNWYAAFLGMILPFCLVRGILVKEKRLFWFGSSFLLIAGLLISLSRGGWLGFICFVFVSLLLFKKHYWKIIVVLFVGAIVTGVTVSIISPSLWASLLERSATILVVDYRINRISIWSQSLDALKSNPLIGIGVANNPLGSAHSNFLQILIEQGIIGLTVFIMILLTLIQQLLVKVKLVEEIKDYVLGISLLGTWIWFSVQGLLSTTLFNEKMFVTFACLLAITTRFLETERQEV